MRPLFHPALTSYLLPYLTTYGEIMSEIGQSSDETCSYSDEEVASDMEGNVANEQGEQNRAVEAILEENEALEEQETVKSKASGKHKAPKSPTKNDMLKALQKLQTEINSLKRPRKGKKAELSKKPKIETSSLNVTAFERPCSSRPKEAMEGNQLSSGTKLKQLSSANTKQLKSATRQLRSESNVAKASSTNNTVSEENENIISIQANDEDDPLLREQAEIQLQVVDEQETQGADDLLEEDNDSSEDEPDEENDEGILEEIVGAVDIQGDDEIPGPPLIQVWADKVNQAWKNKISKVATNALLQKYRTPSNLDELKVPKMNKEIWKLCNKWQKKADLNMTACQRYLIKVVTAVLRLNDLLATLPRSTRQIAMQITADSVALLGKVNRELASKRKISARPALIGDYKSLATNTEVSGEQLFGDNLTQDIKDVQTRRKIGDPYANSYRTNTYGTRRFARGNYSNYSPYSQSNSNSFLWRGRGRGRPNQRNPQNQRHQHGHYPKKH